MKLIFFVKTLLRILYYLQSNEKRYVNLLFQILKKRPKKILEIGVYNGRRAIQMIEAAKIFNKNIEYYGFDLFEGLTKEIYNTEASKFPWTIDKIKELLNNRAKIFLYKGFTNETLKKFSLNGVNIDFIFIDGGHAIQTIENDYLYSLKIAEKNAYIIFDDFYKTGTIDITKFGSNKIFEKLQLGKNKPKLLPFSDAYVKDEEKKVIKMFMIQNKQI
jgi:predicted O-methyltransferase YrrM